MLGSVSKLRKGSGYNRFDRSSDTVGSPAYTPSRLRPSADIPKSPARSTRKQRSLKAAEDRAIATENLQPLVNSSSDNVQARAVWITCTNYWLPHFGDIACIFTTWMLQVIVRVRPLNSREVSLGKQPCFLLADNPDAHCICFHSTCQLPQHRNSWQYI